MGITKNQQVAWLCFLLIFLSSGIVLSFQSLSQPAVSRQSSHSTTALGLFGSGSSRTVSSLPTSFANRDKQAIESIKAAIKSPKVKNFPLLECEFPPIPELNKLSDGSLRSANMVDDANLAFCQTLAQGLAPLPMMGPKVWLFASNSASTTFLQKAKKVVKNAASVSTLNNRDPESNIGPSDVCILIAPSSRQDYQQAQQLASAGTTVVLVNGFAKDQKSVSRDATMAFYLKPLTYNSQVVGYLARNYPKDWAVIDTVSKEMLKSFTDEDILFGKSNTPDLREPGKLVQKSVDKRAIEARKSS